MGRLTYEERQEVVQDVIDRLLYLSDTEFTEYIRGLGNLFSEFPLMYEKRNGIRIIKNTNLILS
jgi:hypothetical protein